MTYKTAWRMAHLIRNELMTQDDAVMSGKVEADEVYIGGKRRVGLGGKQGRPKPGDSHYQPVFGLAASRPRLRHEGAGREDGDPDAPYPKARPACLDVYTDEHASYRDLPWKAYQHRRIQHTQRIYVSGDIHTNTTEGFWSLVKRGLGGVYQSVSAKHLDGTLNEYACG